ncbi:MAG: bifunctional diguanylate cyclase/phosphodiesterase [Desulfurobacteriaceae bacterium]
MFYLAIYDSLTGLYNRRFIKKFLNKTFSAVLFIDLDHFKLINDVYGHDVGDKVLKVVAERIKEETKEPNVACRLGGDEFLVVLSGLGKDRYRALEKAKNVAKRISKRISEPIVLDKNEKDFILTCSIGILAFSGEYSSKEILKFSDIAGHEAKKDGRNRIHFFDSSLKERVELEERIGNLLRKAILNNDLEVSYQPQVYIERFLQQPKIIGAEALARWSDKEIGNVSSKVFIPIAEESGLSSELGLLVLTKVTERLLEWQNDKRKREWRISVNVSYHQLIRDDFIKNVKEILENSKVPPSKICFEITENILVKDIQKAKEILNYLRSLGLSLSLDDFGTGYSSLGYLQELPIDEIKIDRSFITGINKNPKSQQLVKAIVSIGKIFKTQVLAEGVETKEELQTLLNLGCKFFQGFLFGKPQKDL